MKGNRVVVCLNGHEVKLNDLSVHPEHWNLDEVNRFRCPECHTATTWRYKEEEE